MRFSNKFYFLNLVLLNTIFLYGQNTSTLTLGSPYSSSAYYTGDKIARDEVRITVTSPHSDAFIQPQSHLYIDPSIVLSTTYASGGVNTNGSSGTTQAIDPTLPVGTTVGSYAVSNGSAIYNIPITVPPGTNGMAPILSLQYNSSNQNGLIGDGWNLSGISVIKRINKSIYHNGICAPITLTSSDAFSLDGNNLILTGTSNSYVLENEEFSLITYNPGSGNNDDYFVVKTRGGKTIEYGSTTNSKQLVYNLDISESPNTTQAWYITKMYDNYGNTIMYNYLHNSDVMPGGFSENEIVISEIDYTLNTLVSPNISSYNNIKFDYEKRSDLNSRFLRVNLLTSSYVLREIEVNCEGVSMKKYNFSYGQSNLGETILNQITESGSDGTKLNPITINYYSTKQMRGGDFTPGGSLYNQTNPASGTGFTSSSTADYFYDYRAGDFNGDGRSDLLGFEYTVSADNVTKNYTGNFSLKINNDYGINYTEYTSSFSQTGITFSYHQSPVYSKQNGIVDVNGDGKDDLILYSISGSDIETSVFISTGTGFTHGPDFYTPASYHPNFAICDINGDKLPEVAMLNNGNVSGVEIDGTLYYSASPMVFSIFDLFTGHKYTTTDFSQLNLISQTPEATGTTKYLNSGITVMDVDGDGNSEFFCNYKLPPSVIVGEPIDANGNFEDLSVDHFYLFAKPILSTPGDISTLSGFTNVGTEIMNFGVSGVNCYKDQFIPIDYNGDGISDMLDVTPTNGAYINLGLGGGKMASGFKVGSAGYQDDGNNYFVADINNDNMEDVVLLDQTTNNGLNIGVCYGNGICSTTPVSLNPNANIMQFTSSYTGSSSFAVNLTAAGQSFDARCYLNEFLIGDFIGNGEQEIMYKPYSQINSGTTTFSSASVVRNIVNPFSDNATHYISSITNGMGNTTTFTYGNISQYPPLGPPAGCSGTSCWTNPNYSIQHQQGYPLVSFQNPFYVVTAVTNPDGINNLNKTTYSYQDAIRHTQGLGFLGFGQITETNYSYQSGSFVQNTKTVKDFATITSRNIIDFVPFYIDQIFNTTGGGTLANGSDYTYQIFPLTNGGVNTKEHFTAIVSSSLTNFTESTTTSNYIYDNNTTSPTNDNITSLVININHGDEIQTTTNTYQTYPDFTFVPSRLATCTTSVKRGNDTYTRLTNYPTYSPKGDVLQIIKDPGTQQVQMDYTYFSTGTVNTIKISSPDPAVNSMQPSAAYTYEEKYRFPLTFSNALNQVSNYTYDFKWGKLLTVTSIDNLTTRYAYDGYGRNTQITTPNGLLSTTTYDWANAGDFPNPDPINVSSFALYKIINTKTGSPSNTTFYDLFGRTVKVVYDGFNGNLLNKITTFDCYGNPYQQTNVYDYTGVNNPLINTYTFDNLKRINNIIQTDLTGNQYFTSNTTYGYSLGNTTITTHMNPSALNLNDKRNNTKVFDATGLLINSADDKTSITYTYGGHHNCIETDLGTTLIPINKMTYDVYGRQLSSWEKNSGTTDYQYNAYNQLYSYNDNLGPQNLYTYTYDPLGRVTKIVSAMEAGNYTYDYVPLGTNGVNQIQKITAPNGYDCIYTYDNINRLIQKQEDVSSIPLVTKMEYDNYNNNSKIEYPGSGFAITKKYDVHGYLQKINRADNGVTIWQANAMNVFGNTTNFKLGNNIAVTKTFDDFGNMANFTAQNGGINIYNYSFNFDPLNRDLNYRIDNSLGRNLRENFTYDNTDRLTTITNPNTGSSTTISYSDNGNILAKSDVGTYTYDGVHTNEVTQIVNTSGNIDPNTQTIDYTPFHKASLLQELDKTSGLPLKKLQYNYGPDQQRKKADLFDASGTLTSSTFYQPGYEKIISGANPNFFTETNYINAGDGLFAMYVYNQGPLGNTGKLYYVFTDYLGSILKLSDENGDNLIEQSFDAWGQPRNPSDWTSSVTPNTTPGLIRGFTGHEYLPDFNLINMNGRTYDPINARMLSADNDVTYEDNPQNYNRYSYALNNPLKYTDPSGNDDDEGWVPNSDGSYTYNENPGIGFSTASWTTSDGLTVNGEENGDVSIGGAGDLNGIEVVDSYGNGSGDSGTDESNMGEVGDAFGQGINAGGVIWGAAEMGGQYLQHNNGAQIIGRNIGFGTQQTARALSGTLGVVSKFGKSLGTAGYLLQVGTTGYKVLNGQDVGIAEAVGLGVSTALMGAALITAGTAAAPFIATAALIYGTIELGSYIYNGNTLEENILGK